jgi:hypothetical protein
LFIPNWKKLSDKDLHATYVELVECLSPHPPDCWSIKEIENFTNDFISSLLSSAEKCVPRRIFRQHQRPDWPYSLRDAHSKCKQRYRDWAAAGKPSDPAHNIKKAYKKSKREFRRMFRKYCRNQLDNFYSSLDVSGNDCYRLIRRFFGKKAQQVSRLLMNGQVYEGDEMLNAWVKHFSALASPTVMTEVSGHTLDVENRVNALYNFAQAATEDVTVSPEQVAEIISSLPRGKAVGPDLLSYEHLSFGPLAAISKKLASLFNAILSLTYIPNVFCLSYVIPIPKSGSSIDLSSPSNYRGISLSSSLSKVFEKVLLISLTEILSPRIHSLQGGFRQGFSPSHTSLLVSEGIYSCREVHRKAYLALLDAKKAFDTVWHTGLFLKLFEYGVTGKLWLILYHWYTGLRAAVSWNGAISEEYKISQGVRQGAICSPLLYAVYINDLLIALESEGLGLYIEDVYVGCPTYADDMALLSSDPWQLQLMLDKAHSYASLWHYSFGAAKSMILVFGESATSRKILRQSRSWNIGGEIIQEVDTAKHLGILFSVTSSTLNHTLKSVTSARGAFYALTPYGARSGCLHPKTSMRLYYSYVRPILLYGFDLITPTNSELVILERAQLTILRIILGVPTRTSTIAIHAILGTLSIKYLIYYRQLLLLHSILSLPPSSTQRRLLLSRLHTANKRSFITNVQEILTELDLPDVVLLSQQLPSKRSWKCLIKTLLFGNLADDFETQQACSVSLKRAAHLSNNIILGKMAPFLLFSKGDVSLSRLLNFRIRLLLGCSCLNVDTAAFHVRPGRSRAPLCSLCKEQPEDIEHF